MPWKEKAQIIRPLHFQKFQVEGWAGINGQEQIEFRSEGLCGTLTGYLLFINALVFTVLSGEKASTYCVPVNAHFFVLFFPSHDPRTLTGRLSQQQFRKQELETGSENQGDVQRRSHPKRGSQQVPVFEEELNCVLAIRLPKMG